MPPPGMQQTQIDRHKCHRVVPMEVLVLGLCRTGTLSARIALKQLGYQDTYHMHSMFENPPDSDMWIEAFEAKFEGKGKPFGREEWDQLLGHCMAITDLPGSAFAPELIEAYPDAKVILTTRDVDSWHQSTLDTIWEATNDPMMGFLALFDPMIRRVRTQHEKMWKGYFGGDVAKNGKRVYSEHYQMVRDLVPKDRLLEWDVKEGWEPLCKFLGKKIPEGVPFPKANEKGPWKAVMKKRKMGAIMRLGKKLLTGVGAVGVIVVAARVWRWYGW